MSSLYSGLDILHQKEGFITEAECESIGSTHFNHRSRYEMVAIVILAKSISESLKICEICEQYQLLLNNEIKNIKGVSVCDLCIIHFEFVQFSLNR